MYKIYRHVLTLSISALALFLLSACGGGGAGSNPSQATIMGNVTKGPTAGASICAFVANADGSKGASLGCVTSKLDSSFTLSMGYSGDVLLEASGGSYTDEATGVTLNLTTPLQVIVNAQTGKNSLAQITPLTTLGLNQLKNSGVVNAVNYKSALVALVATLKAKGILPANATTNLLEDMPVVAGSNTNAYGQALIGVARMMNAGTSLSSIVSSLNTASTMTRLATASSAVLSNAQAQLLLTGTTVSALTLSTPLCSKEYDKRWSPIYLGMVYVGVLPNATVAYSPSIEDGTGSNYYPAAAVPLGGLCYEPVLTYHNTGINGGLTNILGTGLTHIPNITAYTASVKTSLFVTDIRCLDDHPNPPYVISDMPWASDSGIGNLNKAVEYFLTTEWLDVPSPPVPVICAPGQICVTSNLATTYTFPLQGGPYGQLGQSCWKKDTVWKFN